MIISFDLLTRIRENSFSLWEYVIPTVLALLLSGIVAGFCAIYSIKRCECEGVPKEKKRVILWFVLLEVLAVALSICISGVGNYTVRLAVYTVVSMCAAYQDIKTRESDDYYHIMILLSGLIGIDSVKDILLRLGGTAFVGLILCIIILITKGIGFGGGDYKYLLCTAFALGTVKGLIGIIAGLILGSVLNIIKAHRMGLSAKKYSYPQLPYLSTGTVLAAVII